MAADVPSATVGLAEYAANKVEVNEGELVELKCLVNANPRPHTITWRKNVSDRHFGRTLYCQIKGKTAVFLIVYRVRPPRSWTSRRKLFTLL